MVYTYTALYKKVFTDTTFPFSRNNEAIITVIEAFMALQPRARRAGSLEAVRLLIKEH